jgi:hypothetical protein
MRGSRKGDVFGPKNRLRDVVCATERYTRSLNCSAVVCKALISWQGDTVPLLWIYRLATRSTTALVFWCLSCPLVTLAKFKTTTASASAGCMPSHGIVSLSWDITNGVLAAQSEATGRLLSSILDVC